MKRAKERKERMKEKLRKLLKEGKKERSGLQNPSPDGFRHLLSESSGARKEGRPRHLRSRWLDKMEM
jgi:hypothetical protein